MVQVLLDGVLPIFAIAAIGYFMGKRGIFDSAGAAIINKIVFLVAVPALGFRLIINAPFAQFDWFLLVGFFLSELAIYVLGFLVSRVVLKCDPMESILLGLAASFGNNILFALPIAVTLFGEGAALPMVAIIVLDSILIFGGTIVIMEAMSADNLTPRGLSRSILQNPPLVSMLFGILFASSATEIPHGLNVFLKFVGDIAAPSALFSLGIILSQTNAFDRIVPSVSISIIKLLAHPIFAWIFLSGVFGFMLSDVKTSMMAAAAPCGTMAFVLALNYQVRTDAIAPAILFTTLGSLASLTIVASW